MLDLIKKDKKKKKENRSVGKQNEGHVSAYLALYFPFLLHLFFTYSLSDFSVVNFSSSAARVKK